MLAKELWKEIEYSRRRHEKLFDVGLQLLAGVDLLEALFFSFSAFRVAAALGVSRARFEAGPEGAALFRLVGPDDSGISASEAASGSFVPE
jgi:hypothetical protein